MPTLAGQVAIISGAAGDIGAAVARELSRRGADVALGDVLEAPQVDALGAEITALGRRWRYDRVDVTDAAAVAAWVQACERGLGTPTLIVPNAAVVTVRPLLELTPREWSRDLRINLDGAFHLAQAAAKRLVELGKPGRIVMVGSWAAERAHRRMTAYCASKGGLRMLTRCLALELAEHGILVNEVAPGYVNAGLSGKLMKDDPAAQARAAARVPIGRLMSADDVARQVAHLCEPGTDHLTGATLLMDGGLSLRGATDG
jgi:NAD(P)-dependent dehydrogenase (short-subunit alcohol dehydrogenase family)